MAGARWSFIPDLLREHLDELGFLWGQREASLRSPDEPYRAFRETEERIDAHLQGVLAVGEPGGEHIEPGLESDDPLEAFAAAFSFLHLGPRHAERVLHAFAGAEGERLEGVRMALAHGPLQGQLAGVWALLDSEDARVAAAAAEVLAFHDALRLSADQLRALLRHPDAGVRRRGWRLVAYLHAEVDAKSYAAALRDEDPSVGAAALHAGAWCRVPGVLAVGRQMAAAPSAAPPEAPYLLAVLGTPQDLPLLRALAEDPERGPDRFAVLGAFGSPALIDVVLAGMEGADPATAAAAGAAFTRMTGVEVGSGRSAPVGPEPDDPFAAEFRDEVELPDPEAARRHWHALAPALAGSSRICRGLDLDRSLTQDQFDRLDMASRAEACLRGRYYGAWAGSPLSLERRRAWTA